VDQWGSVRDRWLPTPSVSTSPDRNGSAG